MSSTSAAARPEHDDRPPPARPAEREADEPERDPERRPREARRDAVQDLGRRVDAVARGQLLVPLAHLRDDLAVPALPLADRSRRAPGRRARTSRCSRTRTRRSRTGRPRRGRVPAGSGGRPRPTSYVGGGCSGAVCSRRTTSSRSGSWVRNSQNASATPREVRARVLPDRLERGAEQHVVVRVAALDAVGDRDQPHGLVVRAVLEVRVERDVEAAVRLAREHLLPDEPARRARVGAVLGRDRLVREEHAEERNPRRPAAGDGRLVVADRVVGRPRAEEARPRPRGRRRTRRGASARRRERAAAAGRPAAAPGSRAGSGRAPRRRRRAPRTARPTAARACARGASAHSASPVAKTASLEAWW